MSKLIFNLSESNLTIRAVGVLKNMGIKTSMDLLSVDPRTFKEQRNCGRKTIVEIEDFINKLKKINSEYQTLFY